MSSASYPREKRIRRRADFVRIQSQGARVNAGHFLLLLEKRARADAETKPSTVGARLGVVASRKIGCAVVRNRAKRLLREAFRLNADLFPAGVDVVIIVRPGAHLLTLSQVTSELRSVARQIARRASAPPRAGHGGAPFGP